MERMHTCFMRWSVDVGTGGAVGALSHLLGCFWIFLNFGINDFKYNVTCSYKCIKTNMIHDLLYLVNKSQQQAQGTLYWLQSLLL